MAGTGSPDRDQRRIQSHEPQSSRASAARLILPLLLLFALGIRLYGLMWHLPVVRHPDESRMIFMTLAVGTGKLVPPDLIYGSLMPYVVAILYGIMFVVLFAIGRVGSPGEFATLFCQDPTAFYLIARLVSVASGVVAVYFTFAAVRRLTTNRTAATLAGAAMAVYPIAAYRSQLALPDAMLMAFAATVFYLLVALMQDPGNRRYHLLTGIAAGMGTGVKALGAWLVVAYVFVVVWHWIARRDIRLTDFLIGLAAAAAGFIVAEPAVILAPRIIMRDLFEFQAASMQTYNWTRLGTIDSVLRGLWRVTDGGIGIAATAGMLVGLVQLLRTAHLRRRMLPIVIWLFVFIGWLSTHDRHQHNWIMPSLPVASSLFGVGFIAFSNLITASGRRTGRLRRSGAAILFAALLIPPTAQVVRHGFEKTLPDTRVIATRALEAALPAGSYVLMDGATWALPDLRASEAQIDEWLENPDLKGRWSSYRRYLKYQRNALEVWDGPTYRIIRLRHPWWGPSEEEGEKLIDIAPMPPIYEYDVRALADYAERGVDYIITTDDALRRFDDPDYPSAQRFYAELREHAGEIMRFSPTGGIQGPEIYVYEM